MVGLPALAGSVAVVRIASAPAEHKTDVPQFYQDSMPRKYDWRVPGEVTEPIATVGDFERSAGPADTGLRYCPGPIHRRITVLN